MILALGALAFGAMALGAADEVWPDRGGSRRQSPAGRDAIHRYQCRCRRDRLTVTMQVEKRDWRRPYGLTNSLGWRRDRSARNPLTGPNI